MPPFRIRRSPLLPGCRRYAAHCVAALLALAASTAAARTTAETRTAAYFDRIAASPPQLRMFLQAMPKGADLHNHLGGSVYAEDYLRWAAEQGLCFETEQRRITRPPCDLPGRLPASELGKDPFRYGHAIDALSTRGLDSGAGTAGHERFFAAFDAFRAAAEGNIGRSLVAVRDAAARDRVAYVELMAKPRAIQGVLDAPHVNAITEADFPALLERLSPLLPAAIERARAEFDGYETEVATQSRCRTAAPSPACAIEVRYQVAARRNQAAARVFAELAFGFALADADARFVGVNIAAPEHDPVALRDYALHMRMLAFLRARHASVPPSLHAGELALGLVAAADLRFHIRDAVTIAGAKRIGHGVDIGYETDARALLERMARERIAVEINLSSNAVVLGVKGADHPLALYRAAGVPVVLSTDDQGVLRSDLTHEYQRATQEHGLRYLDLKRISRDGLEYAFIAGAGLWRSEPDGERIAVCATSLDSPSSACLRFLDANPKARLQWQLEQDLATFENGYR